MKTLKYLFIIVFILAWQSFVSADGLIVIDPHPHHYTPTPYPLQVKYHHVDVKINGETATTYIDQEFYNPNNWRMEGDYLFPVPKGAVLKKFSMYIDGKEVPAELLDAKKARQIYEDIVRKMKDPALLEYSDMDLFRARVYPIEPRSDKRIKISYSEILQKDNGTIEYIYPLNTEKFSSAPLQDVVVNIDIKAKGKIKNVFCPTHNADIVHKDDDHTVISYEDKNVKPDTDFKVYYNTDKSKVGLSLLSYKEEDDETGFFFLSVSPGFDPQNNEISEKDITFVLDVSGSMAGEKMDQAKKALLFCVNNLNQGDRFDIIRFSTEAEALFNKRTIAEQDNIKKARKFINDLKAIGGTHIEEALKMALQGGEKDSRPHMIIFITDGKPTIGETTEDGLLKVLKKENLSNTRIFTFGIGHDINTHLLDKITELTKAYRSYITPQEDIEIKISNFYEKVQSPVLTDLELDISGVSVSKIYPKDLPDLFRGSALTVLGRYKGQGKTTITLEGRIKDKKRTFTFDSEFTKKDEQYDFIPPLWASRRIGYLLDQIRLHGEDKELVEEITQLARKHGIITPYTSYLILEDETTRISRRDLEADESTLAKMPAATDMLAQNKSEYYEMEKKSGEGSVRVSKEFQALNQAYNMGQTEQGKTRLKFKDKSGNVQNLTQQVKNIQGRSVYNNGDYWVDSYVQDKKKGKANRIQFASKEYFTLLKKEPQAAQFMSLGRNVRFVLKNKMYEIYE
ncbi:MAG: VWA domain-containing protein [Spirochaetes bacterium]|nr:VWA domain-containing protein [Spirochaetota bacterium]